MGMPSRCREVTMLHLSHPNISVPGAKDVLTHSQSFAGQRHLHVSFQHRLWQTGSPERFVPFSPSCCERACPSATSLVMSWKHLQTVSLYRFFVVKNTRGGGRGEVERSGLTGSSRSGECSQTSSCTQLAPKRKQHFLEAISSGGNFFRWIYHQLNSTVESKKFSWNEFGLKTCATDSCVSLEIDSFHFSNPDCCC